MGKFLENLRNAVESGEFNSDAAKRINEIALGADKIKINSEEDLKELETKLKSSVPVKELTDEEKKQLSLENEKYEEQIKEENKINSLIASIMNQDDSIMLMIEEHVNQLTTIEESYIGDKEKYQNILDIINKFRSKYSNLVV